MQLIEVFSDSAGESHFRQTEIGLTLRDFAPPSQPIHVSAEMESTTSLFLQASPGWDKDFHPTPRRQLAVLLHGEVSVTATDGETVRLRPGGVILLNDQGGKGHLTQVQGDREARFLLIGLA